MNSLHIYRADTQPLVDFIDHTFDPPERFQCGPRRRFHCHECGRLRWAKSLHVQVYYDGDRISCADLVHRRSSEFPFEYGMFCPPLRKDMT